MRKASGPWYALLGALPQAVGYVGLPLLAARGDARRGWRHGRPGLANATGILPAAGGAAMIGWAIASHYRSAPTKDAATVVPEYLAQTGAYAISRNPFYVGGAAMWAGWACLLGSRRVATAGACWAAFIVLAGVPFEERLLTNRFGDAYRTYRTQVPRWFNPRQITGTPAPSRSR